MLKKIRWRFINAAMLAFTAVILTLLCVVNVWNYYYVTKNQDATLELLIEADNRDIEVPKDRINPPFDTMGSYSKEVPYMIRFFTVHLLSDGEVDWVNQDYIASISETDAIEYASKALGSKKNRGYLNGYRYLVEKSNDEIVVLFLNSERELKTMQSLILITVIIALVCLLVVFSLIVLFSKKAIAPYIKNMEAQKQFITNASHELKTPLTAIATSADVLASEYTNDEWIQNIQTQTTRLSKLITNLVTLSRLDEEDPFPVKTDFSLSDALWEISESFNSLAKAKSKSFSYDIVDNLHVIGDKVTILQMVSILLDNALKYSNDHGSISLVAKDNDKRVEILVSNTVDRHIDTSHLFERFYRDDKSHSNTISGNGIGLSIAKATVDAHGGKISCKAENNMIIFRVIL